MLNFIKCDLSFCGSNLKKSMTVVVFRHWLNLIVLATFAINFSRCFLLTSRNSFFAGLISLHLVLFRKFKGRAASVRLVLFAKIERFSYFFKWLLTQTVLNCVIYMKVKAQTRGSHLSVFLTTISIYKCQ